MTATPDPRPVTSAARRVRLVRRAAAILVAGSGVLAIASAVTIPIAARVRLLDDALPVVVPLAATGITVAAGVGLILLATGLLRGQRRAHRIAVTILAVATVGHLVKAIDIEEAVVTGLVLLWLVALRNRFRAPARQEGVARALGLIALVAVAGAATAALVVVVRSDLGLGPALVRAFRGMVGMTSASAGLPFVAAALTGLGIASVTATSWVLVQRVRHAQQPTGDWIRDLVLAHGTDSLAYFALRDDKRHFRSGDTVVSYGVFGRVAIVSPDPIGPPDQFDRAVADFLAFATGEGWIMAVLAAGAEATAHYRRMGLRTLYLGDEAVAHFDNLALSGSRFKPLRGAVNRAVRGGWSVAFLDPARLTDQQRARLDPLVSSSRRGEAERGFSMTLGRLFDPRDTGLLLAVASGPDGEPGAFCQFVPSSDIGGWSLDVMRRAPDTPNGLMDFLLIMTMRHLAEQGGTGLGLNFATMRSVVDPDEQPTEAASIRVNAERRLLHALSESFQIESLFTFNDKYDPEWRPRHLVFESVAHLPEIAVAVARAESFWEIPIVGRFLRPATAPGTEVGEGG